MFECQTTLNEFGNITAFNCGLSDVYSFLVLATLFVAFFYLAFIAYKK